MSGPASADASSTTPDMTATTSAVASRMRTGRCMPAESLTDFALRLVNASLNATHGICHISGYRFLRMTILVDNAIWAWRGRRWPHLISDETSDELHGFATSIGKLRVSFQGDHYDVDEHDRDRAIAAGAVVVDGRDIVRALRTAGLRKRPSDPAIDWERHVSAKVSSPLEALVVLSAIERFDGGSRLLTETSKMLTSSGLVQRPAGGVLTRRIPRSRRGNERRRRPLDSFARP